MDTTLLDGQTQERISDVIMFSIACQEMEVCTYLAGSSNEL